MDELRFVRREDLALIVANDADEEFRLVVDDSVLSELRHLSKRDRDPSRVRPREIQALIRAGKTRAQVAEETGLDDADIERYEEPVLAERRYILELAHAVPVRTDASDATEQRFGSVIAERLVSLGADASEWASWRDEETGWMISLEFISHDVAHRAVWSFEHRKGALSPVNPDAVTLSKQGDVGDRLIPKLRAVDSDESPGRFDSGAFESKRAAAESGSEDETEEPEEPQDEAAPEHPAPALSDANAEYERRREIDQRAIKTSENAPVDLSQTADLLDALRKRRGEREMSLRVPESHPASGSSPGASPDEPGDDPAREPAPEPASATPPRDDPEPSAPRSIWSAAGVSGAPVPGASELVAPANAQDRSVEPAQPTDERPESPQPEPPRSKRGLPGRGGAKQDPERGSRKGRASIPSWDDILFGTRSDEDPA